jgi:hypothetical protein
MLMKTEEILKRREEEKLIGITCIARDELKDCACDTHWPLYDIAIDSTEWPEQETIYYCRKCGGRYVRESTD